MDEAGDGMFDVTLDTLINSGEPTIREKEVLKGAALGILENIPSEVYSHKNIGNEILNIAPFLRTCV